MTETNCNAQQDDSEKEYFGDAKLLLFLLLLLVLQLLLLLLLMYGSMNNLPGAREQRILEARAVFRAWGAAIKTYAMEAQATQT